MDFRVGQIWRTYLFQDQDELSDSETEAALQALTDLLTVEPFIELWVLDRVTD